jgi:hypothetical protein
MTSIPRGKIKEYREKLNREHEAAGSVKYRHGRYQQRTRLYGDYLYAQDREHFMINLREWLESSLTTPQP